MPELVIGEWETESLIRNGFCPYDLGVNMATKFYPGTRVRIRMAFLLHCSTVSGVSISETPGVVLGFIWGGTFQLLVVFVLVVIKWRAMYRTN